ncbi:MAG: DUF4337 family protein [Candidatus Eremiobacteraeota bacterium]|nr:DUF4337 family protein [Candidatus Eremiobacteraeota bacterium]
MSEQVHRQLAEAQVRQEESQRGNKLVSLAAAIIAVLAALGTLFSHHRSISAITSMNRAILYQTRASDKFAAFEASRVRVNLVRAIIEADVPKTEAAKRILQKAADETESSSNAILVAAQDLEEKSQQADERAETILRSYETLEIGTTFCEVAIVLVSISALANTRILLTVGCTVSTIGLVMLLYGLYQGR